VDELDPPGDEEIFVPSDDDLDPAANEQMQQGREDLDPDNALYDPYFPDAEQASSWEGTSEYAEGGG
jgi:hypothetical protein